MFIDQKLNVIKMSPKLIFRFNTIPIKISADIFEEIDRIILRFIWKWKESRMIKILLEKKSQAGVLTLPDFKTYYKATVIKTV